MEWSGANQVYNLYCTPEETSGRDENNVERRMGVSDPFMHFLVHPSIDKHLLNSTIDQDKC